MITTKASVLECTINSLKRLQSVCNQLVATNKKLQTENAFLRQELERVNTSRATQSVDAQDPFASNSFSDSTLYNPQDDAYSFFEGIPQVNSLELANGSLSTEPSKEHSPNSSPTNSDSSGGNSPQTYLPQHLIPEEEEEDPLSAVVKAQGYKISRQKLFLIFLFLVPFCFSLENLNLPLMGSTVSSTARVRF